MKKLFVLLFGCFICLASHAQDAASFVTQYKLFVTGVEKMDSMDAEDKAVIDSVYDNYTEKYHSTYKAKMTSNEIGTYTEYRTRYLKKMAALSTGKWQNHADKVGKKVKDAFKKTDSKVSGFVKGLFGTSKNSGEATNK